MVFDFKRECKDIYRPKTTPSIIDVPIIRFIMVDGKGDPNTSEEYQAAVELLYGLSYTIKMSKKGPYLPDGYFDYVVPPLEGLWSLDDGGEFRGNGTMIADKSKFLWTVMIRQPDFVTQKVFAWAKDALAKKKPVLDMSQARLADFTEGLCGQVMHIGAYDDEPATVALLESFIKGNGYATEMTDIRRHHEIYLGDPRKTAPEKLRTIIRHPVMKLIEREKL
ncbi:MAG: GyrI-like domain-containing protein [Bifidobacterium sp.]|uniref:GyrI-like domain-containing protein n=1 Tax=Bifidobacterium sp. TaxID=41200 RepID=UPI0039EA786D